MKRGVLSKERLSAAMTGVLLAVLALLACGLFGLSQFAASGVPQAKRSASKVARSWHFKSAAGRETVRISVSWGACSRKPAPTFRSKVRRHPGKAVITVFINLPPPTPGAPCHRLRLKRDIRVKLGAPVSGLDLYDGSSSPPILRRSAGSD